MTNPKVFSVSGWNEFYDGYLAYILGEPEPIREQMSEGWLSGWDTAAQTKSLGTARYVMVSERGQGHVRVV